jgi:hypothetical protein
MSTARANATVAMLPSGKARVAGGQASGASLATTEIYDPVAKTWSGGPALPAACNSHTATVLRDGRVLLVGGLQNGTTYLATACLYDPAAATVATAGVLKAARAYHSAVLLASGHVLVCGDRSSGTALASCEDFDPTTGQWSDGPALLAARYGHSATVLGDGSVLVAGGRSDSAALSGAGWRASSCFAGGTFDEDSAAARRRTRLSRSREKNAVIQITGTMPVPATES